MSVRSLCVGIGLGLAVVACSSSENQPEPTPSPEPSAKPATSLGELERKAEQAAADEERRVREQAKVEQLQVLMSKVETLIRDRDEAVSAVLEAKTEEAKAAAEHRVREIEAELSARRAELDALRGVESSPGRERPKPPDKRPRAKRECDPSDPLCGL